MSLGYHLRRATNTAFKVEKQIQRRDRDGVARSLHKLRGELLKVVTQMHAIQEQISEAAEPPPQSEPASRS